MQHFESAAFLVILCFEQIFEQIIETIQDIGQRALCERTDIAVNVRPLRRRWDQAINAESFDDEHCKTSSMGRARGTGSMEEHIAQGKAIRILDSQRLN